MSVAAVGAAAEVAVVGVDVVVAAEGEVLSAVAVRVSPLAPRRVRTRSHRLCCSRRPSTATYCMRPRHEAAGVVAANEAAAAVGEATAPVDARVVELQVADEAISILRSRVGICVSICSSGRHPDTIPRPR